jgi:hypothetical protein
MGSFLNASHVEQSLEAFFLLSCLEKTNEKGISSLSSQATGGRLRVEVMDYYLGLWGGKK